MENTFDYSLLKGKILYYINIKKNHQFLVKNKLCSEHE